MEDIEVLFDRVIIKPDPIEQKTKGGIIIPGAAEEKPTTGEVIAVGPGMKDYPTKVKVGDKVKYSKNCGSDIDLNGETHLIVREGDIWCILNKNKQ